MTFSTSAVAVCCCSDSTVAQLVEQPRILDGDDGLGGEVLHELDLFVGEGIAPRLRSMANDANHSPSLQQRHSSRPENRRRLLVSARLIFVVGKHVLYVDDALSIAMPDQTAAASVRGGSRAYCFARGSSSGEKPKCAASRYDSPSLTKMAPMSA